MNEKMQFVPSQRTKKSAPDLGKHAETETIGRFGSLGGRIQQIDSARGNSDDEVEAFIRGEAMPVTLDPQQ
jgi:transcription antitermination factor NusG